MTSRDSHPNLHPSTRPQALKPARRAGSAPLRIGFQMDPLASLNPQGDSTLVLMVEAERRGFELFYYHPKSLSLGAEGATAIGNRVTFNWPEGQRPEQNWYQLGPAVKLHLASFDVIWLRQDPPFDLGYITSTHILETVMDRVLVLNHPVEVRNAPEKIFVMRYPELMPPTLISSQVAEIREFRREHRDIIIKPLFGNGGAGVFHLRPDDENLTSLLEIFARSNPEPLMIQKYIPAIRQGDKRIILVDGQPIGAINRVPVANEARANMHAGGKAEPAELSPRDREVCAAIGDELKNRDLVFVGIDMIGDYLTEINVTSPTGLQEINRFNQMNCESLIWDAVLKRFE
ncbi:MAG: glutathione synthase [Alphaproteobacteria bacterium]|nr:glutathione synthase [Alphaproteobacteria bacterium]